MSGNRQAVDGQSFELELSALWQLTVAEVLVLRLDVTRAWAGEK
jgi:hypothetical protein